MADEITKEELAEIVKALLPHIPAVERIERVDARPGDVIVIECASHLPTATMQRITEAVRNVWEGYRVVVIDQGMRLKLFTERKQRKGLTVEQAASMIRDAMRLATADSRPDGIEEILEHLVDAALQARDEEEGA